MTHFRDLNDSAKVEVLEAEQYAMEYLRAGSSPASCAYSNEFAPPTPTRSDCATLVAVADLLAQMGRLAYEIAGKRFVALSFDPIRGEPINSTLAKK